MSEGFWSGGKSSGGRLSGDEEPSARADENRRLTCLRAREAVRRLVSSNFTEHSKFITLTFRNGAIDDVRNVQQANVEFEKFIKRLRRRYEGFKYVAVIEFQDENGRGAVHYHMISDLPFIANEELAEIWGQGFVRINDIRHVDNVGAYMVAYMLKDVMDGRLRGNKAYLVSRNVVKPVVMTGRAAEMALVELGIGQKKEVFAREFETEHLGKVAYKEYNPKRGI